MTTSLKLQINQNKTTIHSKIFASADISLTRDLGEYFENGIAYNRDLDKII